MAWNFPTPLDPRADPCLVGPLLLHQKQEKIDQLIKSLRIFYGNSNAQKTHGKTLLCLQNRAFSALEAVRTASYNLYNITHPRLVKQIFGELQRHSNATMSC